MTKALSSNRRLLARLREELEKVRWTSDLFDSKSSVASVDAANRLMWDVKMAQKPPMHIIVSPIEMRRSKRT